MTQFEMDLDLDDDTKCNICGEHHIVTRYSDSETSYKFCDICWEWTGDGVNRRELKPGDVQHFYGMGKDKLVHFRHMVEEEHKCTQCDHRIVCRQSRDFCINYVTGSSGEGCQSCSHKYTKYDQKNPIKCFWCKHFKQKEVEDDED
jgi:hypothetical protein